MNSTKNNEYIDLIEIAKSVWTYKFMLIALAVVIAVLSVVKVEFFTKDTYVAYGILYVSNGEAVERDEVSQSDLDTAKSMVATYRQILKTRSFLSEVSLDIENTYGKRFSWSDIGSMTSINAIDETELMRIAVTAYSPEDAYYVAESMVRHAPEKLGSVFKSGTAEIIDEVIIPSGPVGKGAAGEAAKGAVLGLFIGLAIIVIMNLFDTKIHKSEDVARRYNVSVLGEIAQ